MKKFAFLLILFLPAFLKSECCITPEFKASYYRFNSSVLRDIYGSGGALIQGEINYKIWCNYYLFADVGYLKKSGKSLGCHEDTCIRIVPISGGMKYRFCFNECLDFYLGAGLRYFNVNIHNDSDFVRRHVCANGVGGVFSGGLYYKFCNCLVFNPFIEYSCKCYGFNESNKDCACNIRRHDLDVSGFSFGAGIGYCF